MYAFILVSSTVMYCTFTGLLEWIDVTFVRALLRNRTIEAKENERNTLPGTTAPLRQYYTSSSVKYCIRGVFLIHLVPLIMKAITKVLSGIACY